MNSSYECFPAPGASRRSAAAPARTRGRLEALDNAEFRRPAAARPPGPAAADSRPAAAAVLPTLVSAVPAPRRASTRARGLHDGEPACSGTPLERGRDRPVRRVPEPGPAAGVPGRRPPPRDAPRSRSIREHQVPYIALRWPPLDVIVGPRQISRAFNW
ncbi:hypothetical protein SSP531S_29910 [Streptomyces spongiicola]|uniref:Uncharacterized protein n=1 Tax=Streptomyces spongiicola TaxID=1690221 RepID=A0A388T097_9ACTN|nr:hypothetical protein SSP531S_29910 [Streptomyces spongiicola]